MTIRSIELLEEGPLDTRNNPVDSLMGKIPIRGRGIVFLGGHGGSRPRVRFSDDNVPPEHRVGWNEQQRRVDEDRKKRDDEAFDKWQKELPGERRREEIERLIESFDDTTA